MEMGQLQADMPGSFIYEDGDFENPVLPFMPPDDFFVPGELEQLKEQAITDACRLVRLLCLNGADADEDIDELKELKKEQDREDEETDCRIRALRVARRQMWRQRIRQESANKFDGKSGEQNINFQNLQTELSDMEKEAKTLQNAIEQRKHELAELLKQQEQVSEEIQVLGSTVTDLEAAELEKARRSAAQAQAQSQPHFTSERRTVRTQSGCPVVRVVRQQAQTTAPSSAAQLPHTRYAAKQPAPAAGTRFVQISNALPGNLSRAESVPVLTQAASGNTSVVTLGHSKSSSWLPSPVKLSAGGISSPGGMTHSPSGGSLQVAAAATGLASPGSLAHSPGRTIQASASSIQHGGLMSPGGFCHSPGNSLQAPAASSPGGFVKSPGGSLQVPARPSSSTASNVVLHSPGGSMQVPPGGALQATSRGSAAVPSGGSMTLPACGAAQKTQGGLMQMLPGSTHGGSMQLRAGGSAQAPPGGSMQAPSSGGRWPTNHGSALASATRTSASRTASPPQGQPTTSAQTRPNLSTELAARTGSGAAGQQQSQNSASSASNWPSSPAQNTRQVLGSEAACSQTLTPSCPHCGNVYIPDAMYCRRCGVKREPAWDAQHGTGRTAKAGSPRVVAQGTGARAVSPGQRLSPGQRRVVYQQP